MVDSTVQHSDSTDLQVVKAVCHDALSTCRSVLLETWWYSIGVALWPRYIIITLPRMSSLFTAWENQGFYSSRSEPTFAVQHQHGSRWKCSPLFRPIGGGGSLPVEKAPKCDFLLWYCCVSRTKLKTQAIYFGYSTIYGLSVLALA